MPVRASSSRARPFCLSVVRLRQARLVYASCPSAGAHLTSSLVEAQMIRNRITTLTALGAAFLLAACSRGDNAETGGTTDSAAGAVNTGTPAAAALSDAEIVGKL